MLINNSRNVTSIIILALFSLSFVLERVSAIECLGEVLGSGETIYPGQFIGPSWSCSDSGGGYRFGLNENGYLGAWGYDDEILWHSGIRGDYLRMQGDGNLVLNDDDGTPQWAYNCFGDGIELVKSSSRDPIVQTVDDNGRVVWQIYSNGLESECYPDTTVEPALICYGDTLGTNDRLDRGEYICDGDFRFGLSVQGKLSLWDGRRAIWTQPLVTEPEVVDYFGDFITMQGDGNLVLYKNRESEPTEVIWATDCFDGSRSTLQIQENVGVRVQSVGSDKVHWLIDSDGNESEDCDPTVVPTDDDDCSSVSSSGGRQCVVQMIDFVNMNIVNIQVLDLGGGRFEVIDNYDSKSCSGDGKPWTVSVEVDGNDNQNLDIAAGVPDVSCNQLLTSSSYQMEDDSQLMFRNPDNLPVCNKFARNLVYFLVLEWFYFG